MLSRFHSGGGGKSVFLRKEGPISLHNNEMMVLFSDLLYRLPHKK